jgi:cephalosporin hydroxylase
VIELGPKELSVLAINGFGAMQKPEELEALLTIVNSLSPKIVLEIGVGKGGTAWCWSKFSSVESLFLVDLPGGPWGGGPTKESVAYIASHTRSHVHFIAGNSANSECLAAVKSSLNGEPIDFLMIDGDHSYEGVKTDFLTYEPLVKEGGLIAFHDICEHSVESKCEVKKFWDEVKETWPAEKVAEFIAEPLTWGGIGCLKK